MRRVTSKKLNIVMVSPAAAESNNGNWHTAYRWKQFLSGHCDTALCQQWPGAEAPAIAMRSPDAMVALHARRSADSIAAWAASHPDKPLVVVLTGTDLYRDIHTDALAQQSLALATHLVVLQQAGVAALPEAFQAKAQVIYQSAPALKHAVKSSRRFTAVMVGHLRAEKDPLTFMKAALSCAKSGIRFTQIGLPLDDALAKAATDTAQRTPHYRYLGGLPRAETRQRIKCAHVLVNASEMEGGAHVILEAVQSGTPVLASRISGNLGMLGTDYAGYFELGDAGGLSALVTRCAAEPAFLALLQSKCSQRAALFQPAAERRQVNQLVLGACHQKKAIRFSPPVA